MPNRMKLYEIAQKPPTASGPVPTDVLRVLLAVLSCCLVFGAGADMKSSAVAVYEKVKDSLVIVRGSSGVGSGFVARADGKTWLYTNEHVVRGGESKRATFVEGREVAFKGVVEVAKNRDLVRIEIEDVPCALNICPSAPVLDEHVFVFGNSDGGGVLTKIEGAVVGVGSEKVEVSAKFVRGNSGSAILNSKGEVLGVATEAVKLEEPSDWVKWDTRFNDVRRYGERLSGAEWQPVDWEHYRRQCRMLEAFAAYREFLVPVCFKDKRLVTDYSLKEVGDISAVPALKAALTRLQQCDKRYLKALDEFEKVMEKRKTLHPGSIQYPKTENINIRYRKLKRMLLECIAMRKAALKSAVTALKGAQWKCVRLEQDADWLLSGFKYCIEAYEQFNDSSLSQVNWRVE